MEFSVREKFQVKPDVLIGAWLDSQKHTEMTGGVANITDKIGDEFDAWDGYIFGTNLVIENHRIVQEWRTTEFLNDEDSSHLEILFQEIDGGSEIIINHSNLPAHGMQYKQGWIDHYFEPMKVYFG